MARGLVSRVVVEATARILSHVGPREATAAANRCSPMWYTVVFGDLLDQEADAIVNAWNRNVIPWWLLIPQGVSGAIKKRAGTRPFRELARFGPIPLGGAVITSAGALPHRAIIHVAGIDMLWRASKDSIRRSVASSVRVARQNRFDVIAMPIIGAGSGGMRETDALTTIVDTLDAEDDFGPAVVVVRYRPPSDR